MRTSYQNPATALQVDLEERSHRRSPTLVLPGNLQTLEGQAGSKRSLLVIVILTAVLGIVLGRTMANRGTVQPGSVDGVLFDAVLQPASESSLSSESTGTIDSILVQPGDHIEAGQLLMRIRDRDAEGALEQALIERSDVTLRVAQLRVQFARSSAALAVAQRNADYVPTRQWRDSPLRARTAFEDARARYRRAEELFAAGVVSRQDFEAAESAFRMSQDDLKNSEKQAEATVALEALQNRVSSVQGSVAFAEQKQALALANLKVEAAKKRLDRCEVKASRAGVVVQVLVHTGDQVGNATQLLKLANLDYLVAEVPVSASAISLLSVGSRAVVALPSRAQETVEGKVLSISPIPAANMMHSVRVQIPNPSRRLLVKQPAKVRFR
ncbi:MAG: hypothetical protein NVSMB52_06690 [Chloroflexota bacterium]